MKPIAILWPRLTSLAVFFLQKFNKKNNHNQKKNSTVSDKESDYVEIFLIAFFFLDELL
jgi:hypothetical protein